MSSFASPTEALAAILECLDGLCTGNVHSGSLGSGETLTTCPCLLRVETGGLRPQDGAARSLINLPKCRTMILDVVINYRRCLAATKKDGSALGADKMTEQGLAVTNSWWDALATLACCKPTNEKVRFVNVVDVLVGGDIGWTMTLEADIKLCGCEAS